MKERISVAKISYLLKRNRTNLQKIAESTKHTLIQARVTR